MANGSQTSWTLKKEEEFIAAFLRLRTITHAARAVNISRSIVYTRMDKVKRFRLAVQDAKEQICDELEAAAVTRALTGGPNDRGSHVLSIFLLKSWRRDVYGDRQEITGPAGGPIIIERSVPRPNYDDNSDADID